jgi:hypothetical protein
MCIIHFWFLGRYNISRILFYPANIIGSISRGAPFRLVFKIIVFSAARYYLTLFVGYRVLAYCSCLISARLSLSIPAFIYLGISSIGFSSFFRKYKDNSDFALFF